MRDKQVDKFYWARLYGKVSISENPLTIENKTKEDH